MLVTIKFKGGLDLLFSSSLTLEVESMKDLIQQLRAKTTRPDLFADSDSLRPGILCLINDQDWDLTGQMESPLHNNDEVVFISTLHGG